MNRNSPVLESKRPRRPRWLSLEARLSLEAPPCLLAALLACLAMAGGCRSRADTATTPETPSSTRPDQAVPAAPASSIRQVPSPALDAVRYESGRSAGMNSMLEMVGGGVACFDFDRDGYCDLYFPGGGTLDRNAQTTAGVPGTMLRGGPAWEFHNVTAATGTAADRFYSHGATVADYTHDGFSDLLVYGYQGVCLVRNQGDGTFQDVTHQSGLTETPWVTAAAWGDLDGDGQLDLYLASYVLWDFQTHQICTADDGTPDVCSPTAYFGSPDSLFLGSEDGRFSDQSTRLHGNRDGKGLGAIIARLSDEVELSVYVANDLTANAYWVRNEQGDWEDRASSSGVAVDALGGMNASMGVALLDFHGNKRFDILVTNFEHELIALYQNEGNHFFRYISRKVGLHQLDARVVGFGVVAADWDGDGDEDVLLTSGHVQYYPPRGDMRQPAVLLENDQGRFHRRLPDCDYFHQNHVGRGVALADLDNDGYLDVVITHLDAPPVILETEPPEPCHWVRVHLVGTASCRTPIGAVVRLVVGDRSMVRQLYGGGSYLSQSQPELFFHWPRNESADAELQVQWPSGNVSQLGPVTSGQRVVVVEP